MEEQKANATNEQLLELENVIKLNRVILIFENDTFISINITQSDEQGQFFYRKNGYKDIGNFILPGEVSELILYKEL